MPNSAHLRHLPSLGYGRTERPPADRMTRVTFARPPAEASHPDAHSYHDPARGVRSERTHLDRTVRGGRTACCTLEGCIHRRKLQDGESSQLLFGVSIGTILYAPLSFLNSYGGSRFRQFQRIAPDKDARLDQSLVVGAPGAGIGITPFAFA